MKMLHLVILAIAVLTFISGLVQLVRPGFVLDFVGGEDIPATRQFFGTIGLFMLLFGGLIAQTLYEAQPSSVTLFWGGLQKFGAALAVGIGISHGLLSPVAGLVAGFDFVSGILFLVYLRSLKKLATRFLTDVMS